MAVEIRVPALGESIVDAVIVKWLKQPGDPIARSEPLVELETDKVNVEVPAEQAGTMGEILRAENKLEKEYLVAVNHAVTDEFLRGMARGVPVHGQTTLPCKTGRLNKFGFRIVLVQGLNRQIRRMCSFFGYTVVRLQRVRVINITLEGLRNGQWRELSDEEVRGLLPDKPGFNF